MKLLLSTKMGPQHNRRTLLIPLNFLRLFVSHSSRHRLYFMLYCYYYFFGYDIIPSQYECTHIMWIMEEYHNPPTRSILNFIFFYQAASAGIFIIPHSLSRMLFNIQHRRTYKIREPITVRDNFRNQNTLHFNNIMSLIILRSYALSFIFFHSKREQTSDSGAIC